MNALLLQNAKCKMQRSESRAENSLSGYAERRMLSNVVQMQRTAGVGKYKEPQECGYFLRFSRLDIYTLTPKMLPA